MSHMNVLLTIVLGTLLCSVCGEVCRRNCARCPDYNVTKKHENYEERNYPSLVWISTSESAKSRSLVSAILIDRLYDYLRGGNEKKRSMEMMVPVRTAKIQGSEENSYTMSLIVSMDPHNDPPMPTNPDVIMTREPESIYFARSFTRNPDENQWDEEARLLNNSLVDGQLINSSFYYWAIYDSPWTWRERLNEVWMVPSH